MSTKLSDWLMRMIDSSLGSCRPIAREGAGPEGAGPRGREPLLGSPRERVFVRVLVSLASQVDPLWIDLAGPGSRIRMGDRFVVVPVDGGVAAPAGPEPPQGPGPEPGPEAVPPANRAGGRGEAAGTSEADPQDPQDHDGALPILEYNREPNRYGRTGNGHR